MRPTVGSLFSGIGGFDLGLERAGWEIAWQVEIDSECQRVLTRHWPDVPRFADVRDCGAHNLTPVNLICFGSPCQDLSVAGKRAGLGGKRSGLFFEAVRIIRELRPAWALWENVPGALSSAHGRDFGAALDALADAGALDIGWTVLDAQWFGVAQRRRRLFTLADFGGQRADAILPESESCPGHPPAGREAGPGVAAGAQDGAGGVGFRKATRPHGADDAERWEQDELTGTLNGWEERHEPPPHLVVYQCQGTNVGEMGTLRSGNGRLTGGVPFVAGATQDVFCEPDGIAPTLAHSSCAHRGHNEPKVLTFNWQSGGDCRLNIQEEIVDTLQTQQTPAIARPLLASPHGYRSDLDTETLVAHTLSSEGADASEDGTGRGTPLVPLMATGCANSNGLGVGKPGDPAMTLDTTGAGAIASGMAVRRLTPRECARLQAFPDDWLDLDPPLCDSTKYRMLGNAVVSNVAEWIGRRILEVAG